MLESYSMCWLLRSSSLRPNFDTGRSKCGRNFDQTSTPDMSKFRPNFDQTSTPPVSKFGRNLLDICMHHIVNLINMSTKLRHQTSTRLRPNFDQTSTPTSFKLYHCIHNKLTEFIQTISCFVSNNPSIN